MVPNGWLLTTVGHCCKIRNEFRLPINSSERKKIAGPYPYFGPTGILDHINEYRIDCEFAIIGEDGDHFLKYKEKDMTLLYSGKANINNHAHIITDSPTCLAKWFHLYFVHRDITAHLTRQGAKRYKLTKSGLSEIPILLPPISEQREITSILSVWDQAITSTKQLLANMQLEKIATETNLLSGKAKFPGYADWETKTVGDFITESRIQGTTGDIAKKITVRLYGQGVVAKNESRAGSESTKYYRRSAGQFIYSKLDFLNGAFGIIPQNLDGYESTLDLPAFDFKEHVDSFWFLKFVSRESFYISNLGLANGGRKARRINPGDFLQVEIKVPTYEEQKKIARMLCMADQGIENLQKKLTCLKQEKKALMQQLLTGKRRVQVDEMEIA